ncbi:MAG: hypothetical protein N2D54_09755 [Chloroflexota bacterium]
MRTFAIPTQAKAAGLAKVWQPNPMLIRPILIAPQPKLIRSKSSYEISK